MSAHLDFKIMADPVAQPRYQQSWTTTPSGKRKRVAYVRPLDSGEDHPVVAFKQFAAVVAHNAIVAYDQEQRAFGDGGWNQWMACPMSLKVVFVLLRLKSLKEDSRTWAFSRPDLDNLIKALKDAFKGVVWNDDSQVVELHCRKVYAAVMEKPHLEIRVTVASTSLLCDDIL